MHWLTSAWTGIGVLPEYTCINTSTYLGDAFDEQEFDKLMNEHRYLEVAQRLVAYRYEGYFIIDPLHVKREQILSWIFARADRGDFLLLYWAAKICLTMEPYDGDRGHLYLLKAHARLLQDVAVFPEIDCTEKVQAIEKWFFEFTQTYNGWLSWVFPGEFNRDAVMQWLKAFGYRDKKNVQEWLTSLDLEGVEKKENFVSPTWLFDLFRGYNTESVQQPEVTNDFCVLVADRRSGWLKNINA